MKQISSVDLYFLTRELKILENQRIDTFYYENDTFYVKIYVKGKGSMFLTNKISKCIYIGDEKSESSEPSNFIQYLRKYLKNGYISEIRLIENERVIDIKIEKKEIEKEKVVVYHLILELFANGNVIVTDDELNIKNSLLKQKFKDRTVMVHDRYELPPQKEISLFNLDEKLFDKQLKESDLTVVKFLAIKLGMGGKFSEEVCFRSKIDKNKSSKELTIKEIESLIFELKQVVINEISAKGVYKDDKLVDFIPFDFVSINEEKRDFASFNEVIKEYFKQFESQVDLREKELEKELKKLQNRLDKQLKQKEEVLLNYEKYNDIGNKIYENYALIEELLNSINKAAKEKGWDYVEEVIKNNEKLSKIVAKLDYKNNEIILKLG